MKHLTDHMPVDARSLSRLRWRSRRGLLENDLFVQRFFQRHGEDLNQALARGLGELMDLADNDLLDFLLRRRDPGVGAASAEAVQVLGMMRSAMRDSGRQAFGMQII